MFVDETDMAELEKNVRAIQKDGLVWGGSKLVAVGYGVKVGIKCACYYVGKLTKFYRNCRSILWLRTRRSPWTNYRS